ncbi:IS5/IS1182 family transposase, partial [Vibrio sp. 10N.247.310.24]
MALTTRERGTQLLRLSESEGTTFWERGHPQNLAVGCQKLYGSHKYWKERYGYHKRSLSETAMYRVKQLLGGRLSLRNYNAQVGETYAMI